MDAYIAWLANNWVEVTICFFMADRALQILAKLASRTKWSWDDKAIEVAFIVVDGIKDTIKSLISGSYKNIKNGSGKTSNKASTRKKLFDKI